MSVIKRTKSVVGLIAIIVSFFAYSAGQSQGAGRPHNAAILASLALPESRFCIDTKERYIESNIAFTNLSDADIEVALGKGANVTVEGVFGTRTLKPLLWGGENISESAPKSVLSHTLLHPRETVTFPLRLRLDEKVFSEPGFYKVKVDFDAVGHETHTSGATVDYSGTTNWAIFEIHECTSQ
jgi:hypothetical protein